MRTQAVFRDEAALARLRALGLTRKAIYEAVRTALIALRSCDEDWPSYFPGGYAHASAVHSLRQKLKSLGWERQMFKGVALVKNPKLKIALGVTTGDENTGNPSEHHAPQTKNRKGGGTRAVVARNQAQMSLFTEVVPPKGTSATKGADVAKLSIRGVIYTTFYLVYRIDRRRRRVSLEVSMPCAFKDDKIVDWKERIVLPDLDLELPPVVGGTGGSDDGSGPVVVEVTRK